jgi:hypothetical protein
MIEQILNTWLSEKEKDLIANYDKLGLRASGNWANQLEQFNEQTGKGYHIGIKGEKYTGALETGRSANKNQTPKAIKAWVGWAGSTFLKKWISDKGLNLNPFAVAYKIARHGWKVPNAHNTGGLVSNVITKESLNDLQSRLTMGFLDNIKSDIIKTLK